MAAVGAIVMVVVVVLGSTAVAWGRPRRRWWLDLTWRYLYGGLSFDGLAMLLIWPLGVSGR